MPIRLRMSMHGKSHKKIFHIVAIDSKLRRDAKPAELLGVFNPHSEKGDPSRTVRWSVDRLRYWLSVGAVPSKSVTKLLQLGDILNPGSPYDPRKHLLPKKPIEHMRPSSFFHVADQEAVRDIFTKANQQQGKA